MADLPDCVTCGHPWHMRMCSQCKCYRYCSEKPLAIADIHAGDAMELWVTTGRDAMNAGMWTRCAIVSVGDVVTVRLEDGSERTASTEDLRVANLRRPKCDPEIIEGRLAELARVHSRDIAAVTELWSERAAVREYLGGQVRADAENDALDDKPMCCSERGGR